jgi:integrase
MSIHTTKEEFDRHREDLLLSAGGREKLGRMSWEEIAHLELFAGSSIGSGMIVIPEKYLPAGRLRKLPARTVYLFRDDGERSVVKKKREEWIGRAALALWLPYQNRGKRTSSPATWLQYTRLLLRLTGFAVSIMEEDEWDYWPGLQEQRAQGFARSTINPGIADKNSMILDILERNSKSGLMFAPRQSGATLKLGKLEASYALRPGDKQPKPKDLPGGKSRPFPNAFVSKLMKICLWLLDNLADQIIECWALAERLVPNPGENKIIAQRRLRAAKTAIFQSFEWRDAENNPVTRLPFEIYQREGYQWSKSHAWPPESYSTIISLMALLQVCNASMLAFCTGGRHHEIAGMVDNAAGDELIRAITYKFSRRIGGVEREWPLHDIAERAIAFQEKLASAIRPTGTQHLWVQLKNYGDSEQGSAFGTLSNQSHQVLSNIGLDALSEGRIHMHRWRHTIARLIGITVDEAQEVLMDLLGHADIESGLTYLLSDPEVAADAIRIADEAALILAKGALHEVASGSAGGPVAERLFVALQDYKMQRGIMALGTDDIEEAARLLTLEGTAFRRVRGGILCTKAPGQLAPCTRGRGQEDIGSCSTVCDNRLELQVERQAFELELRLMAAQFADTPRDHVMIRSRLAGQLLAQARRWPKDGRSILEAILHLSDVTEIFGEAA